MHASAQEGFVPFSGYFSRLDVARGGGGGLGTPYRILWLQCGLVVAFLLSGSYESLINMYSWMVWVFYGGTVLGLVVLRRRGRGRGRGRSSSRSKRMPVADAEAEFHHDHDQQHHHHDHDQPPVVYQAPLWVAWIFVATSVFLVGVTVIRSPMYVLSGSGVLLAGVVAYRVMLPGGPGGGRGPGGRTDDDGGGTCTTAATTGLRGWLSKWMVVPVWWSTRYQKLAGGIATGTITPTTPSNAHAMELEDLSSRLVHQETVVFELDGHDDDDHHDDVHDYDHKEEDNDDFDDRSNKNDRDRGKDGHML